MSNSENRCVPLGIELKSEFTWEPAAGHQVGDTIRCDVCLMWEVLFVQTRATAYRVLSSCPEHCAAAQGNCPVGSCTQRGGVALVRLSCAGASAQRKWL